VVHVIGNSTIRATFRRAQRVIGEYKQKKEATAVFIDCSGGGSGIRDDHASSAHPRPPSLRTQKSRHAKKRARGLRRHFVARKVGGAGHRLSSWHFLASKRRLSLFLLQASHARIPSHPYPTTSPTPQSPRARVRRRRPRPRLARGSGWRCRHSCDPCACSVRTPCIQRRSQLQRSVPRSIVQHHCMRARNS